MHWDKLTRFQLVWLVQSRAALGIHDAIKKCSQPNNKRATLDRRLRHNNFGAVLMVPLVTNSNVTCGFFTPPGLDKQAIGRYQDKAYKSRSCLLLVNPTNDASFL